MSYEEFICAMLERTREKQSADVTVERQKIAKNNGVTLEGLVLRKEGESIAPVIYLESFYERYLDGESLEKLVDLLLERNELAECPVAWDYQKFFAFEEVRELLVFRMVSTERNREMLKEVPHISLVDFSVIFHLEVAVYEEETGFVLIKNEYLKAWGITVEELYTIALKNTERKNPESIHFLSEFVSLVLGVEETQDQILVVTNKSGFYGASVILYPGTLKNVYEKVGRGYYLLPASVHEFLVVPDNYGMKAENLEAMVREINATQIPRDEFLSDHVYHYDGHNITKM